MKIIKVIAGIILVPALVIMFSECSDLGLTWLRFLAAGYVIVFGIFTNRSEGVEYGRR